jgi:type IV secretory pathway VirB4 component
MSKAQSTQQFIDIQEVRDGVIFLKNGGLRQLIMVSGINFDLKSENEQDLMTYAYQNLLNGLDFSLQIFIHSRRINVEPYLQKLRERQNQETNELLKTQIAEYIEFIKTFVANNAIMDKTFFVVVSYDPILLPQAAEGVLNFFKRKFTNSSSNPTEDPQHNLQQLRQRVDQVIVGIQQMGLRAVPLGSEETIELIYNLHNPQLIEKGDLAIAKENA